MVKFTVGKIVIALLVMMAVVAGAGPLTQLIHYYGINWPVLGGMIAGVVVGLVIFFLIRRRGST